MRKARFDKVRLELNNMRRDVENFCDDSLKHPDLYSVPQLVDLQADVDELRSKVLGTLREIRSKVA